MKKALTIVVLMSLLLSISFAHAQVPTPPDVATLGPSLVIVSSGSDYTNVKITSPTNQTTQPGELKLSITVEAVGLLGQFGNVGYNIDGGTINSIRNLAKSVDDKTGYPEQFWYKTTAKANVALSGLPNGLHTITVYYGWQYPAYLEVSAYSTVVFVVGPVKLEPRIYITSPSNQSTFNNNSIALRFYLSQIQSKATTTLVYYSLDGENHYVANFGTAEIGSVINKVTTFNEKIANLTDGFHSLSVHGQVYYFDSWLFEGNSSIEFNIDSTSPTIIRLSITNTTYHNQNIPLSLTLNERASWIAYNLDNQGNVTIQGNTTLPDLTIGSHTFFVYANDTFGNMGKAGPIYFEIKTPEFPAQIIIVATVTIVGISVVVFFKFRKGKTLSTSSNPTSMPIITSKIPSVYSDLPTTRVSIGI
jgi:hypothetical protein